MAEEYRLKLTPRDFDDMFSGKYEGDENIIEKYYSQFGPIRGIIEQSKDMEMGVFWDQVGRILGRLYENGRYEEAFKYSGMAAEHRAKEVINGARIEY